MSSAAAAPWKRGRLLASGPVKCALLCILCEGGRGSGTSGSDDIDRGSKQPAIPAMNTLHPREQCTLYLAESSIPNSGIGIYTAVDVRKGQQVGEEELLIPLTESEGVTSNLKKLVWTPEIDGRLWYESNEENKIIVPGLGAQINCHFGLNNIAQSYNEGASYHGAAYDSAGLHRGRDPGAGAFTYWHGVTMAAKRNVRAGEELFISYGAPHWFANNLGIGVPSEDDYVRADAIIAEAYREYYTCREEFDFQYDTWSQKEQGRADETHADDDWRATRDKHRGVLKRLLPESHEDLEEAHRLGSARFELGGESSFRTHEWLEENGMCIDNMYAMNSTIPQAGRGAFAKRFVPKGSIVSPAPALQIHRRQLDLDVKDAGRERSGKQLLANYVWGHRDSDVALVPYNIGVNFINHGGKGAANAEIRWSESPLLKREYLELDAEGVLRQGFGLLLEIVATRDIQPDEEILLDYGEDWERAWKLHVESWAPLEGSAEYVEAEEVLMEQSKSGLLTEEEQKLKPYPNGTQTACYFFHVEGETQYNAIEEDEERGVTVYRTEWEEHNDDCLRHVKILSRTTNGTDILYDVEILPQTENLNDKCLHDDYEVVYVNNIPSRDCCLVKDKFMRDTFLPNAFRHLIGLPDHVLPAAWKHTPATGDETGEARAGD